MTNFQGNKLVKRLALLFVLGVAAVCLRTPEPAYATTCQQQCLLDEHACVAGCGGNSQCSTECILEFKSCVNGCNH
jgi:hypothetical protein